MPKKKSNNDQEPSIQNTLFTLSTAELLSKAASQLCSTEIAEETEENYQKVWFLFPEAGEEPLPPAPESSTTDVGQSLLMRLLSETPKSLAAGPSGLRVEHPRTLLSDRRTAVDSVLLELFIKQTLLLAVISQNST